MTQLEQPKAAPLTGTDRISLAYLAALAVLAAGWQREPAPLLSSIAALAILIVGSAIVRSTSKVARTVHDFIPFATVVCAFTWTGAINGAIGRASWDGVLADVDRRLFGTLPEHWFGALGRPWWLTDAASLAYVSYYVLPVVMVVALYASRRRVEFDDAIFTAMVALLVTFGCYFVLPALGPRVAHADAARMLGGGTVSAGIRTALLHAEGDVLDAFPSGHTTVSLVYLACGWRLFPRWRGALVVVVAGIVFSTVYLSLHYVIDVVAGVALAALLPPVLPVLRRWTWPAPPAAIDPYCSSVERSYAP